MAKKTSWLVFSFIALALMMMALSRGSVILFSETINEGRWGYDFSTSDINALKVAVTFTASLFYLAVLCATTFRLVPHPSTRKPGEIQILVFISLAAVATKILFSDYRYVDMAFPVNVIGFALMALGFHTKNLIYFLLGIGLIVAFGAMNSSKAALIRPLFGVVFLLYSTKRIFSLKAFFRGVLILPVALYGTIQLVSQREGSGLLSFTETQQYLTYALDVISMRFNFIDGYIVSAQNSATYLPTGQFFNNMFVFLPFIDIQGQSIGAIASCQIDANCLGERSGAFGLPGLLIGIENSLTLVAVFFTAITILFFLFASANRTLPLYWAEGLHIYLTLSILNVFVSANLDVIFSEVMITLLAITFFNLIRIAFWQSTASYR